MKRPFLRCPLCGKNPPEARSHVVPKFIFRWIKETSATGYLRFTNSINRREQDGPALRMLCMSCEALLQKHEDEVHDHIFLRIVEDERSVEYNQSLLKFGESLLLRSLWFREAMDEEDDDPPDVARRVSDAVKRWRLHLLGEQDTLGPFEVHLIPVDRIKPGSLSEYSGRISHYLTRTVDMDVLWSDELIYVMVLIPHMLFLGRVYEAKRVLNRNSRIATKAGLLLEPGKLPLMPRAVWDHLIEKARYVEEELEKQSDVQKAKIDKSYAENPSRAYSSRTFEAAKSDWLGSFILKAPKE